MTRIFASILLAIALSSCGVFRKPAPAPQQPVVDEALEIRRAAIEAAMNEVFPERNSGK